MGSTGFHWKYAPLNLITADKMIVVLKVSSHQIFDFYTWIPYIPKLISSVKWNQRCSPAGSFRSRPQRRLIRSHTWLIYGKRLESDLCCLHSFPELRVTSNKQIKMLTIIQCERAWSENPHTHTHPTPSISQYVTSPVNHFSLLFPRHVVGPSQASACPSSPNPQLIHICSS